MKLDQIPLKGGRTYLQSADIYHELVRLGSSANLGELNYVKFKEMVSGSLLMISADKYEGVLTEAPIVCSFYSQSDGAPGVFAVVMDGGDQNETVEYDEELAVSTLDFIDASTFVVSADKSGFTNMELIVAGVKRLHKEQWPSVAKWLVTQITQTRNIAIQSRLEIRAGELIGSKISVNKIYSDDQEIGSVRFVAT